MEQVESKAYSWKWVTATELLSLRACEVLHAFLTSAAASSTATLYDGEDTSGEIIAVLEATTNISLQIHFSKPVYCRRGLYVVLDSNVAGLFIQWRELPQGIGY